MQVRDQAHVLRHKTGNVGVLRQPTTMTEHGSGGGGGGVVPVVPGPRPVASGGCPIAAAAAAAADREERRSRSLAKGLKDKFVGRRAADGHGDCDTTF